MNVTFLTVLKKHRRKGFLRRAIGFALKFFMSARRKEFRKMCIGHSIYLPVHVYALKRQIEKHYKKPHRFICLTDFKNMKCETIPLKHNLPGWWSKLEIFQPSLVSENRKDVFIFFDLDTCILDDISELVEYPHTISGLLDAITPELGRFGSGICAWRGDYSHIYTNFMKDKVANMMRYQEGGDQHVIHDNILQNGKIVFKPISEIMPGCLNYIHQLPALETQNTNAKDILPPGTKIVYFHGHPKPWDPGVAHPWLDKNLYDPNNYEQKFND